MELNREAWAILTSDEKTALSLQLGLDKSTWQAGEIMDKSHYKYLEIKYRAVHFLKLFTQHLSVYGCLIPDYVPGNKVAIQFFKLCIEKRLKPMEALAEITKTNKINKSQLQATIIETLAAWQKSDNAYCVTVNNLVKEFDRWNNFRILPKSIQEPSAFKRRIKNAYKRQVKITSSIPTISLDRLIELYGVRKKAVAYLGIIYAGEPKIIPVKINHNSAKIFSEIGLYYFEDKADAEEYIACLNLYVSKGKKECTDGLNFWPKYRELIKKAKNYAEVQKITPNRRHLQMALKNVEFL